MCGGIGSEATVFLVDDDAAVQDSLAAAFRTLDLAYRIFSSAQEFLDAYDEAMRGCLIVDVRLPGISGMELLETLRQRGSKLPTLLITGHGDEEMESQARRLGAEALLQKPFQFSELVRSIRAAIESQVDLPEG
jgi:FixJ family two-component response regulator